MFCTCKKNKHSDTYQHTKYNMTKVDEDGNCVYCSHVALSSIPKLYIENHINYNNLDSIYKGLDTTQQTYLLEEMKKENNIKKYIKEKTNKKISFGEIFKVYKNIQKENQNVIQKGHDHSASGSVLSRFWRHRACRHRLRGW